MLGHGLLTPISTEPKFLLTSLTNLKKTKAIGKMESVLYT